MLSELFQYHVIAVIGAQGSGKGTQLMLLKDFLKNFVACFAMSGILKHYYAHDPAFAEAQALKQSRGVLIGDGVIVSRLKMYAKEHFMDAKCIVADGFPRTAAQAFALEGFACRHFGQDVKVAAVVLEIEHEVALRRCLERAAKAKKGIGEIRDDDRPDLIEDRLRLYFDNLPHVVDALHTFADVFEVDASRSESEVHKELLRCLEGKVKPLKPV